MDQPEHKASTQSRLLVLSSALLFYYYSEAKVEGFSVLGTTVRFGNANALIEFAWAVWAYYYLRTYQYYKDIGQTSYLSALRALFVSDFSKRMSNHQKDALRVFKEKGGSRPLQVRIAASHTALTGSFRSRGKLGRILQTVLSVFQRMLRGRKSHVEDGELSINLIRSSRFRKLRRWLIAPYIPTIPRRLRLVIYPEHNLEYLDGGERIEVPIPWLRVYWLLWVHVKSVAARPSFWENYGPLVLGLLPVWYVIYLSRQQLPWLP